ncbi:MAG: HEAT repeat domain-containing protein [Gemmatimonadaceae bacterium]|nr:HEAT repeat domain-containing protein [Gemmatimonadaceae bacterium]
MKRTTFALLAICTLRASTLVAQPRPAKAPPAPAHAPAPVSKPAPVAKPAPAAPRAPLDPLDALDAADVMSLDLAQIRAEAMAAIPQAQIELARIQAQDMAVSARALAEAQVALNLDASNLAAIAEAPVNIGRGNAWGGAWSKGYRTAAPEPWAPQDVADSLYREARKALSADQYEKSADLFRKIWRVYPQSAYAADAYYWQAFALQRQGGDRNLGEALASLETQAQKFPKAATLGDARSLRARIEGQLGRGGDLAMATTLRGRAERVASDGCPRADEDERIEALNAVMQMDREQALPILKKVLARREPCTQALRRTAVMLIARNKQPEVAQTLMGVAKNDPDREVREQAVFWLANVQTDEAVDMLIDLAKRGDDLELRKRAVYSLSRAKSPKAQETLRQIVLDENQPEELRGDALTWVTSRGNGLDAAQAFAYLKEVYAKGGTMNFRQRVLSQISVARSDESRTFFVSVALNEREPMDLRRTAVSYLGASGRWSVRGGQFGMTYAASPAMASNLAVVGSSGSGVSGTVNVVAGQAPAPRAATESEKASQSAAATALTTVYEKVSDLDLKRQALSSLATIGEPGIDKLLDVAKNEKNTELRRSAVSYLSRTKDPRALQLLQDIINK